MCVYAGIEFLTEFYLILGDVECDRELREREWYLQCQVEEEAIYVVKCSGGLIRWGLTVAHRFEPHGEHW